MSMTSLARWWTTTPTTELVWIMIGNRPVHVLDALRRAVARHREGAGEHYPGNILVFSLAGGAMLLTYAIYRMDPVFVLGQAAGLVIYAQHLFHLLGKRAPSPAEIA
jgi:lipid-A-disaccharide synthase-like uncharacterized protein